MSVVVPAAGGAPTEVTRLLGELAAPARPLEVGDARVRLFLANLASRLLSPSTTRQHPDLAALGFFLRETALAGLLSRLATRAGELRMPRGLVFHIPPANVDALFGYSWALSLLAGNSNVVRLSERASTAATALVDAVARALADADPDLARTQHFVRYPRDSTVTATLSSACDLRVIWGGDATVTAIRRHPIAPKARDLTFPDRSSLALFDARGWVAASQPEREAAASGLHDDVFLFDQAACSSPRTLVWIGGEDVARQASAELVTLLRQLLAERGTGVDAAMAVEKHVAAYGLAATSVARRVSFHGNDIAVLELEPSAELPRTWLGAGTLAEVRLDDPGDLVPLLRRRDQTIVHFGFESEVLARHARAFAACGVDRLVPVGEATRFGAVWDGYDLLHEFSRLVTVRV
ncbi:acyl-CoA reductase [Saccharomonospora xinjiangensis]|uniref:acyl-CoA reductase n=1 Tax=Saccharomonospora xinjiangensis TaxID=75294 RepID=UPI00106FD7D3|nr:acyl-CoA reductase [Saccharomonospora xinjiangensis]QBQ60733.1 Acyl-CoA reductase (LuxC) [Saccharomonospora xinjiangensis]